MPPTPDAALENRFPVLPPPSIIFQFTNMSCLVWNMPAAGQGGQKCKSNFIICHGQFFSAQKAADNYNSNSALNRQAFTGFKTS